jgi:hypothetical protein
LIKTKKCPECGGDMEEGYVPFITQIRWGSELNPRGEMLNRGGFWRPKKVKAYLCRKCQLIILQYGES